MSNDPVNHPEHYTSLPCGIEVIEITQDLNFCLGNVIKYVLRADLKGTPIQDLQKARWYLDREIDRRIEKEYCGPFSDADEDNPTLPFMAGQQ